MDTSEHQGAPMAGQGAHRPTARTAALKPFGIATVAALLVSACFIGLFLGALHAPTPHDIPVAVVAPPGTLDRLRATLDARAPGAYDLRPYDAPAAAERAILARDVQGAFVLGPDGAQVLVAGASGGVMAGTITATFQAVGQALGQTPAVRDVRPLPERDRAGLSAFFFTIGTVIPSLLFAVLVSLLARRGGPALRAGALCTFAALLGGTNAAVADGLVGALTGHAFAIAGIAALLSLAVAGGTVAMQRLIGMPGIALAAATDILIGIPASGGPVGYQFVPDFFRMLSGVMPTTAAIAAVRNTVYFDAHAVRGPLLVLWAWALMGLAVGVAADLVRARRAALPAQLARA